MRRWEKTSTFLPFPGYFPSCGACMRCFMLKSWCLKCVVEWSDLRRLQMQNSYINFSSSFFSFFWHSVGYMFAVLVWKFAVLVWVCICLQFAVTEAAWVSDHVRLSPTACVPQTNHSPLWASVFSSEMVFSGDDIGSAYLLGQLYFND